MTIRKEPWKPVKPKHSKKCKECHGIGKVYYHNIWGWSNYTDARDCNKCGGKGYTP